jgi:hypothetical protein
LNAARPLARQCRVISIAAAESLARLAPSQLRLLISGAALPLGKAPSRLYIFGGLGSHAPQGPGPGPPWRLGDSDKLGPGSLAALPGHSADLATPHWQTDSEGWQKWYFMTRTRHWRDAAGLVARPVT